MTFWSGGRTKYNRCQQHYPKAHWIDAACVGDNGDPVHLDPEMKRFEIKALGRGNRQACRVDKYGFPRTKGQAVKSGPAIRPDYVVDRTQVMELTIHSEAPPLNRDASGALRVGTSRVLVELVIRAFQDGSTPETIAQRYPAIPLVDVYAVIAYYLRHRDEMESYLEEREQEAEAVKVRIEAHQGSLSGVRGRLLARQGRV